MAQKNNIREQLRRNVVALISLVVAITSLSYNTWRNEQSEENRTQRLVAIEILLKLGQLQQLVYHNHYDGDVEDKGNPRTGWTLVLTVRDIAQILDAPLPESAVALHGTWNDNFNALPRSKQAKDAIEASIESLRSDTLAMLKALD